MRGINIKDPVVMIHLVSRAYSKQNVNQNKRVYDKQTTRVDLTASNYAGRKFITKFWNRSKANAQHTAQLYAVNMRGKYLFTDKT